MTYQVRIGARTFEIAVEGDLVRVNGRACRAQLQRLPPGPRVRLVLDGRRRLLALAVRDGGWTVYTGGYAWTADVADERQQTLRRLVRVGEGQARGGTVRAPMPGLVIRVEVEAGQRVGAGGGLLVLEAMKMENEIRAPADGVVEQILVTPGQAVEKGTALVELSAPPQG